MLPPYPVAIAEPDPDWPRIAAAYADQLLVLGPVVVAVHHIGSTSVPGLAAKPIIDLMPLVGDLGALDARCADIVALGYAWHGEYGIPGRRFCTLDAAGTRRAHLHFFEPGSPHVARHLAFRDYLRAHPGIAAAYAREKRHAARLHPDNSHAYNDEKDAWVRAAEAEALHWSAATEAGRQAARP